MRLTLRTLLAYRDGVLSPQDAEDISRRIHQSEDAANLLKRIEALATRPEKASTTVVGKGLVGDPNSLAEYLDDILASESIPELEKTCLQSSELLAELAGCHTLLSSAMNKRVDVPDSLRETALKLGTEEHRREIEHELKQRRKTYRDALTQLSIDTGAIGASAGESETSPDPNGAESQESEVIVQSPMLVSSGDSIKEQGLDLEGASLAHEVPEYLQGTAKGNWKLPVAICGIFTLLAVLLWQALGPVESVLEMFASRNQDAAPEIGGKSDEPKAASNDSKPDELNPKESRRGVGTEVEDEPAGTVKPLSSNVKVDNADGTGKAARDPSSSKPNQVAPAVDPDASGDSSPVKPPAAAVLVWANDKPDERGVLLVRDAASRFELLSPNGGLVAGQEFLLTPHSQITLGATGVNWQVMGPMVGTALDVGLNLRHGRTLLAASQPGAEVVVESPLGTVKITLVDANSKAAIEMAYRRNKHGSLFDGDVVRPVFLVTAVDGALEITETDSGATHDLAFTQGLAVIGDSQGKREVKEFQMHQIPDWYRMSPARPIDREALLELEQDLVPDPTRNEKTIQQVLQRLSKSRRPEEAALATQLLMLQGDWSGLAHPRCLANPQMSIHWENIIELLAPAIALNPIKAKQLEPALVNAFPDGKLVYKQLCGLDEKSVTGNRSGMSELIEQLASNRLANRATAFLELHRLTGEKHSFQPKEPSRASILTWRREFNAKRVPVLDLPALVWEGEKPN